MTDSRRIYGGTDGLSRRRVLETATATGGVLVAGCTGTSEERSEEEADDDGPSGDTPSEDDEDDSNGDEDDSTEDETDRPVTGESVPVLAPFDGAMHAYMDELDLGAGALGVARDGDLVLERGYGWCDRERTEPLEPDAMFRIGSISKVFTDEVILRLVDAGDLSLDAAVYPLLSVEPPGGDLEDERIRDVTVEHLLNHAGGWNRFEHANPLYDPLVVVDALDLDGPPDEYDVTRYMLDQPLQFEPGTDEVYSNFGYVLLGQVVEAVTGESYQSHLERVLFGPAGAEDIEIGRTRPDDRHPDEVWYDDSEQCPNVFERDRMTSDSCADSGFVLEAFGAAGGHVARARSLIAAVDALEWLWVDGRAHRSPDAIAYAGSHPGSYAYVERRPDGVTYAALVNGRHPQLTPSQAIAQHLEAAVGSVDQWP